MKGNDCKRLRQDMTKQARLEYWKSQICCTHTQFFFCSYVSSFIYYDIYLSLWHFNRRQWNVLLPSISLQALCQVHKSKSCFHTYLLSLLYDPHLHPLLRYRILGCKISPSRRHLFTSSIASDCRFGGVGVYNPLLRCVAFQSWFSWFTTERPQM